MPDVQIVRGPSAHARRMTAARVFIALSRIKSTLDPEFVVHVEDHIADLEAN